MSGISLPLLLLICMRLLNIRLNKTRRTRLTRLPILWRRILLSPSSTFRRRNGQDSWWRQSNISRLVQVVLAIGLSALDEVRQPYPLHIPNLKLELDNPPHTSRFFHDHLATAKLSIWSTTPSLTRSINRAAFSLVSPIRVSDRSFLSSPQPRSNHPSSQQPIS